MVRAFTAEPLAPGTAERLLRAANRAPSAGFSQGYSFLVLDGKEEAAPFWQLLYEQATSGATTKDDSPEQVDALSTAPLVIVPLASKDITWTGMPGPRRAGPTGTRPACRSPTGTSTPASPRCSCCWPPSTKDSVPCSSARRTSLTSAPGSACL